MHEESSCEAHSPTTREDIFSANEKLLSRACMNSALCGTTEEPA